MVFTWLEGDSTFIVHTHIQYICTKPKETNQHNSTFSVIVLAWAGLVNHPATVLHLSSVAIPGKVLATETISVQRLSFTVSFYPLGRAKTLGLFQKCCLSSKCCHTAVNVLPHFTLGFHFCARESYKQLFLALGPLELYSSFPQLASLRPGQELCTA